MVIQAIYENGVFRPVSPVDLPEQTRVNIVPQNESASEEVNLSPEGMDAIYAALDQSFDCPDSPSDLAERHNEHRTW